MTPKEVLEAFESGAPVSYLSRPALITSVAARRDGPRGEGVVFERLEVELSPHVHRWCKPEELQPHAPAAP